MPDRVQHLVLFQIPGGPDAALEAEMRRRISAWAGTISGLLRLRFGADQGGRAEGYQYGLLTEFVDAESLAAYLDHPLHQAFLAWVRERPFSVLRFDYPLTAETDLLDPSEG